MTRQEVPPLLTLSGAVLEAQWERVGHITLADRCRRPVGREKKKNPLCLIFGTRTIEALFSHSFTPRRAVLYILTWTSVRYSSEKQHTMCGPTWFHKRMW